MANLHILKRQEGTGTAQLVTVNETPSATEYSTASLTGYVETYTSTAISNADNSPTTFLVDSSPTVYYPQPSFTSTVILNAEGSPSAYTETVIATAVPTPYVNGENRNGDGKARKVAIGAGVGVSVGVSLILLIVAFLLIRRRKARKSHETISPDVLVTRRLNGEGMNGGRGFEIKPSSECSDEKLPGYLSAGEKKESEK